MKAKLIFCFFLTVICFSLSDAQIQDTLSLSNGGGQDTYSSTGPIACLSSGPAQYLDPVLKVGKIGTAVCRFNSFIQFNGILNNTVLPENAVITKAELHMYRVTGQNTGANDNSQQLYLLSESWVDQTVSNTNLPDEMVAGASYPDTITIPGGTAAGWININVLDHVKFMHCRKINFGWGIRMNYITGTKNVRYGSFEQTTVKPYLYIEYYVPLKLFFSSNPSSAPATNDASISVVPYGGSGSVTASWYDLNDSPLLTTSNSGKTLHTITHGAYKLEVKDNNSNEVIRVFTLVGTKNGETTVTIQPDPFWGFDAKIFSGPASSTGFNYQANANFENVPVFGASRALSQGDGIGLLDFLYEGLTPDEYEILQADIILSGTESAIHAGSNASTLRRIIQKWEEHCVTWNLQPGVTSEDSISIPVKMSSQGFTASILPFVNYWLENPDEKFGMAIKLNSITGFSSMNYASSDNIFANNWPKFTIKFKHKNQYAELTKSLDGSYYLTKSNRIHVEHLGEYNVSKLNFKIYNDQNVVVATQNDPNILNVIYATNGDNRFRFDFGCSGVPLDPGFYIMEVINEKNEKMYLRFKQTSTPNC